MAETAWLAIDTATPPKRRARELRSAWEQFVSGGETSAVREPIALSWQRSHAAGVDPSTDHVAPLVADSIDAMDRWDAHPLAAAAPLIRACLGAIAVAGEQLIVVSDADGLLLSIEGDARVRGRAADTMNFTEGAIWSEVGAGTNAVGTALVADHAVQVFAAEHFSEVVQEWTCAAAPVHDPDSCELLGVIDLTGAISTVHPDSFGCAVATAQAVETHLRCLMHERDQRLRSKYDERLATAGGRSALVTPTGRVIAGDADGWTGADRLAVPAEGGELVLPSGAAAFAEPVGHDEALILRPLQTTATSRPIARLSLLSVDRATVELAGHATRLSRRQTEIVALLAAHPAGLTSEQLALDLYGDDGQPGSVRVEVFRLRKLLGPWIDTEPYRLLLDVESDVGRVEALLDRGAVRAAADCYAGPLLPRSQAPGVVRDRDALDQWLRHSVLSADDDDALWAWLQCPSGVDDLLAWTRLLANVTRSDPRHSLAVARVGALRAALA
jgi:hypothetical protein